MESSYLDRYEILQTFKENELQKVFVARDNESNQAVVINNIYIDNDNSTWDITNQNYKDIFDNILHFEKTDNELVIVTKTEEGLSLDEYLTNFTPSFTERVNLIYQYLNNIKKYNPLPTNTQSVLVDESQIIVNDARISFDELIIFNENAFNIDSFKPIKDKIVSVLQKLISVKDINYDELPLYVKIVGFIDQLRKDDEIYSNMENVFTGFESLNIEGLSMPSNQKENMVNTNKNNFIDKDINSINQNLINPSNTAKNPTLSIAIGAAGIITTILVGLFVFKSILPLDKNLNNDANLASNGVIDINANNFPEDQSSDHMAEIDDNKVVEPNDNIDYLSEDIKKDYANSKYSDYSFKMSDIGDKSHKIVINQGPLLANSQLLMWVKSDSPNEFNISIEGYSYDNLSLKQSVSHKPLNVNSWELVRFTLNKGVVDYLNIIFDNIDGTIWVDRISIDMFK